MRPFEPANLFRWTALPYDVRGIRLAPRWVEAARPSVKVEHDVVEPTFPAVAIPFSHCGRRDVSGHLEGVSPLRHL